MNRKRFFAALDIGTSKLCAAASGGLREDGMLDISGIVREEPDGFKDGIVVDLATASNSITALISNLSDEVKGKLDVVTVNIASRHITSLDTRASLRVGGPNGQITKDEIERLSELVETRDIPIDRKAIHILLKGYTIDGQAGIREPVGMYGSQIELKSQLITSSRSLVQNLIKAIDLSGISVDGIVVSAIADSRSVLTEQEYNAVTALVDIGGEATEVAIFEQDAFRYFDHISSGGSSLTDAISRHFKIPFDGAEDIKLRYAGLYYRGNKKDDILINEDGIRKRLISHLELNSVVGEEAEKLLSSVKLSLAESGIEDELSSNVVMTGGTSLMDGLIEKAEDILGMPVRLGLPRNIASRRNDIIHPAYSTVFGLLKFHLAGRGDDTPKLSGGRLERLAARIKHLARDYF